MSTHKKRAEGGDQSSSREAAIPPRSGQGRRYWRAGVPLLLAAAVIAVVASKPGRDGAPPASAGAPAPMVSHGTAAQAGGIPRLVDVGADKCIPCKAMASILVELRTEYAGRLQVDFIDVWKDPSAGDPYRIYAIPTQIFFDGDGKELTRHEGFISKADILATWKRFGYDFSSPAAAAPRS
jgi:thioredoxin 1